MIEVATVQYEEFCYQCGKALTGEEYTYDNAIGEYICQDCFESGFDISLEDR